MGHIYLVMEYVDHDLAGLIDAKVKLTEARIKCLVKQILDGLNYMHERELVHRDLKCSNILVSNLHDLKLADFGLARSLDFSQHDREEMPHLTTKVVTLWYRAPELLYGNPNYDTAVDMWSLGCIIVELIQGRPLFPASSEVELLGMIYSLLGTPAPENFAHMKAPGSTLECPDPKRSQFEARYRSILGSAFDLVQRLLVLDPRQRLTARMALNNLYFLSDSESGAVADPHLLPKLAGDNQSYHEFETKKVKREKKQQLQAEAAAKAAVKRGDVVSAAAIMADAHQATSGISSQSLLAPAAAPVFPIGDQDMDISDGEDGLSRDRPDLFHGSQGPLPPRHGESELPVNESMDSNASVPVHDDRKISRHESRRVYPGKEDSEKMQRIEGNERGPYGNDRKKEDRGSAVRARPLSDREKRRREEVLERLWSSDINNDKDSKEQASEKRKEHFSRTSAMFVRSKGKDSYRVPERGTASDSQGNDGEYGETGRHWNRQKRRDQRERSHEYQPRLADDVRSVSHRNRDRERMRKRVCEDPKQNERGLKGMDERPRAHDRAHDRHRHRGGMRESDRSTSYARGRRQSRERSPLPSSSSVYRSDRRVRSRSHSQGRGEKYVRGASRIRGYSRMECKRRSWDRHGWNKRGRGTSREEDDKPRWAGMNNKPAARESRIKMRDKSLSSTSSSSSSTSSTSSSSSSSSSSASSTSSSS